MNSITPPNMLGDGYSTQMADAEQSVWSFFVNQVAYIEREVFQIPYPDIRYPGLIPVDTSADRWTQVVTYFSQDRIGSAGWFAGQAQDVPMVETTRNAFSTTVHMAAAGYAYTDEEIAVAARLNMNLTVDKANYARRAAEEFIDQVALFGDTSVGFTGLTNSAAVTVITVPNGAGGTPQWNAGKTPTEILNDFNGALTGIYTTSLTVETADTVLLPLAVFSYLNTTLLSQNIPMTILGWLKENNAYTSETGQPLTIRGLRGLETAGAGGVGRAIAYRRAPDVVKFHMPMPFEFLPPWRQGPMRYVVPGRFRLGGVDVRRPGAFRYLDGVS